MSTKTERTKIRTACQKAADVFRKLNKPAYSEIISKLDFCIASYDNDNNPVGLIEFARIAHRMLSEAKEASPKKVSKKLLDDLQKSFEISNYS